MPTTLSQKELTSFERQLERALKKSMTGELKSLIHSALSQFTKVQPQTPVRTPAPGGKCDMIWKELDALRAANKVVHRSDILAIGAEKGWNLNNVSCEFYNWRRFHGIHK